uniref:PDEase domain-containing protein n=1 Tax=Macrostomum lignano TaxID=282301 RepID=A0A1I8F238_9PLAT
MVLNTDMSLHFQQIKSMKQLLSMPDKIDKSKVLSMVLHCADISHPGKPWEMHYKWTIALLEEFFRQGDREKKLEIQVSPLCDRNTTLVAQSQAGFIDFIMEPSFVVLGDMLEKILLPFFEQQQKQGDADSRDDEAEYDTKAMTLQRPWDSFIKENRAEWKVRAEKEEAEKKAKAAATEAEAADKKQ